MKQAIPTSPSWLAVAVGAALLLVSVQALAADRAGRVLAVSGTVVASTTGGGTRVLENGSRVYTGETIDTRDGRVQIRFLDGALMTLESDTHFRVDEYERRDASAGDADDGGSVFMSLLQGALRTITGTIGDDEDNTDVDGPDSDDDSDDDTDEGTDGDADEDSDTDSDSDGDDSEADTGSDSDPLPDEDDTGDDTFEDDEPEFSESEETGSDVTEDPGLLESDDDPEPTALEDAALAGAWVGGGLLDGGACNPGSDCTAFVDEDGNLVKVSGIDSNTYEVPDGVTLAESGTVGSIATVWGRWSGDVDLNGSPETGDLLWAYSTNPTTAAELEDVFGGIIPATYTFTLATGPSPVGDVQGTDWSVTQFEVSMEYSSKSATIGSVNSDDVVLELTSPNGNMSLQNGSNSVFIDPQFNDDTGFELTLEDTLNDGDEGTIEAVFAGDNGEGLLIQFEARDFNGPGGALIETIEGVKILLR